MVRAAPRPTPAHRLNIDAFLLPGPVRAGAAAGALVLLTCTGCLLHGRIISDVSSAQELAELVIDAHRAAERLTDG